MRNLFSLDRLERKGRTMYDDPMWYVYILEAQDGRLYTGVTKDLDRRMGEHGRGCGAKFTKGFGFKNLLYSEESPTRSEAQKREAEIKRWSRQKKLQLIERSTS